MSSDVLVVGASPSGLVTATYLALAGARVVVLEAESMPGGVCANRVPVGDFAVPPGPHFFHALDPQVIKDLKLSHLGLRFAVRDMPLIGLRSDGKPMQLDRDRHEAHRAIAPISARDADRFTVMRREISAFGRAMRAVWWDEGALKKADDRFMLRRLGVTSTTAWLESIFESEPVRASFAFDALTAGLSPWTAGSALVFAWQAAQEMCGLQAAAAVPRGGPATLVDALMAAAQAAGVEVRCGSEVVHLSAEGDTVTGAVLSSGEIVPAVVVLSSVSRRRTLLKLLSPGVAGFAVARRLSNSPEVGEGKLILALNAVPMAFKQSGRFILSERFEGAVSSHAEARAGKLPSELALEVIALETGSEPPILLSVGIRPLPVTPIESWKAFSTHLVQSVLRTLEHHAPEITALIGGLALVPPKAGDLFEPAHMLLSWRQRIVTPLRGLFLCGEAAEPVPAVSGRAARIAARFAADYMREAKP